MMTRPKAGASAGGEADVQVSAGTQPGVASGVVAGTVSTVAPTIPVNLNASDNKYMPPEAFCGVAESKDDDSAFVASNRNVLHAAVVRPKPLRETEVYTRRDSILGESVERVEDDDDASGSASSRQGSASSASASGFGVSTMSNDQQPQPVVEAAAPRKRQLCCC